MGRTNNLRRRLRSHARPGASGNQATFAFRLARAKTGRLEASYKTKGSRGSLSATRHFSRAFKDAKSRIRCMDVRFIKEGHPVRQALLEIYIAICLKAKLMILTPTEAPLDNFLVDSEAGSRPCSGLVLVFSGRNHAGCGLDGP